MVYYALGSLLFAGALIAALTIMAREFAQYRPAMMKALRSLSLEGIDTHAAGKPAITLPAVRTSLSHLPRAA
ncbi:hypothetical protein [Sphingobium nicotianae]|uniref:hypothetical protein n=1 Tax=Sphingobium nicotianae TaxID=2782607 RepID=UPI001BE40F98|nr:hypothetical protein [Sphingobium nicotianae]